MSMFDREDDYSDYRDRQDSKTFGEMIDDSFKSLIQRVEELEQKVKRLERELGIKS